MTDVELAYIAGLFDGEGDVQIQRYRASKNGAQYLRMHLRITNTHRPVLDWVRERVGAGDILAENRKIPRKPCFRWQLANARAVSFLLDIRPYLIIKADRIDALLNERQCGRA